MPFSRLRKGAFCIFLNPRLNGKPGVVHLYWQLMAYRKYCGIGAENSIMTVYIADFCVRAVGIRVICWLSICWIRISKQIMSAERIGEKQMRIEKPLYD